MNSEMQSNIKALLAAKELVSRAYIIYAGLEVYGLAYSASDLYKRTEEWIKQMEMVYGKPEPDENQLSLI